MGPIFRIIIILSVSGEGRGGRSLYLSEKLEGEIMDKMGGGGGKGGFTRV